MSFLTLLTHPFLFHSTNKSYKFYLYLWGCKILTPLPQSKQLWITIYVVCYSCGNKVPQAEWHKRGKCILTGLRTRFERFVLSEAEGTMLLEACWQSLVFFGFCCITWSLPSFSYSFLLMCMFVSRCPLFVRTWRHMGLGTYPIPVCPHLT